MITAEAIVIILVVLMVLILCSIKIAISITNEDIEKRKDILNEIIAEQSKLLREYNKTLNNNQNNGKKD